MSLKKSVYSGDYNFLTRWRDKDYYKPSDRPDIEFFPTKFHRSIDDLVYEYEHVEIRYQDDVMKQIHELRKLITLQTKSIQKCKKYALGKQMISLDDTILRESAKNTKLYPTIRWFGPDHQAPCRKFSTIVTKQDYLELAEEYISKGQNPCVIFACHPCEIGGTFEKDYKEYCDGFEEDIYRRTTLYYSVKDIDGLGQVGKYQIPQFGGIYSPKVMLLRGSEKKGYFFIKDPKTCSFVLVTPIRKPRDERIVEKNFRGYDRFFERWQLQEKYAERLIGKIKVALEIARANGHKHVIIAGPFGCFKCPPFHAAVIYKDLLYREYCHCFEKVVFCVKENRNAKYADEENGLNNFGPFNYVFSMNKKADYKQFDQRSTKDFFKNNRVYGSNEGENLKDQDSVEHERLRMLRLKKFYIENNKMNYSHTSKLGKGKEGGSWKEKKWGDDNWDNPWWKRQQQQQWRNNSWNNNKGGWNNNNRWNNNNNNINDRRNSDNNKGGWDNNNNARRNSDNNNARRNSENNNVRRNSENNKSWRNIEGHRNKQDEGGWQWKEHKREDWSKKMELENKSPTENPPTPKSQTKETMTDEEIYAEMEREHCSEMKKEEKRETPKKQEVKRSPPKEVRQEVKRSPSTFVRKEAKRSPPKEVRPEAKRNRPKEVRPDVKSSRQKEVRHHPNPSSQSLSKENETLKNELELLKSENKRLLAENIKLSDENTHVYARLKSYHDRHLQLLAEEKKKWVARVRPQYNKLKEKVNKLERENKRLMAFSEYNLEEQKNLNVYFHVGDSRQVVNSGEQINSSVKK